MILLQLSAKTIYGEFNFIQVDGIIEKHEFVALQEAIELLESRDEVHDLMKKVKDREFHGQINQVFTVKK